MIIKKKSIIQSTISVPIFDKKKNQNNTHFEVNIDNCLAYRVVTPIAYGYWRKIFMSVATLTVNQVYLRVTRGKAYIEHPMVNKIGEYLTCIFVFNIYYR